MYQGKHIHNSATKKHRRLRWRKEFVLVCSVLVLFIGVIGGTLAYLVTNTDPVTNTFTPPTSGIDITEDFDPKTVKENVKVENKADYPVYVRATYVAYWISEDGSVIPETPVLDPKDPVTKDWTPIGDYWYYNKVLAAKATSPNFIDSVKATPIPGRQLVIDVIMETVQAEGSRVDDAGKTVTPVEDVWGVSASRFIN